MKMTFNVVKLTINHGYYKSDRNHNNKEREGKKSFIKNEQFMPEIY